MLFPEGRVSEDGLLQRVQPGAALVALRTGVPIVPVRIENTNQIIPYGSLAPRRSRETVRVTYLSPLRPQTYAALPRSKAIAALTEDLAAALS